MIDFFHCSSVHFAISHATTMYKELLFQFWNSVGVTKYGRIKVTVLNTKKLVIGEALLAKALRLPIEEEYVENPSYNQLK